MKYGQLGCIKYVNSVIPDKQLFEIWRLEREGYNAQQSNEKKVVRMTRIKPFGKSSYDVYPDGKISQKYCIMRGPICGKDYTDSFRDMKKAGLSNEQAMTALKAIFEDF